MPNATANLEETERLELKSLPEGYVVLRRMTYGQIVQRRALSKMSMAMEKGSRSLAAEMAMSSKEITLFEFAHCIVEHNLEDAEGRTLNLSSEKDFAKLDPRVGQEIEFKIAKMNDTDIDDEEEQGK